MASTQTLRSIVETMRAYPDLVPLLGTGGLSQEPALTIANDIVQMFLAEGLNWKFNRGYVPPFLTVALQQDYVTNITDLSWLEFAQRLDINNSVNPKPFFNMEAVRDQPPTSYQSNPFDISWVPNKLAAMGTWQKNTAYPCGYGAAQTPVSPIQQFVDANGNILFINSASLNLSINSPGVGAPGFVAPTTPYGTSGNTQPLAPPNSPAGTTVVDGTVTWTVADPNGVAMRVSPIPATSGLCWLLYPVYQKKPPTLASLQTTLSPIPDEYLYLFRQGFLAMAYVHAGKKDANAQFGKWKDDLMVALKSGDREMENFGFTPSQPINGGSAFGTIFPVGPANPYQWGYWGGSW